MMTLSIDCNKNWVGNTGLLCLDMRAGFFVSF